MPDKLKIGTEKNANDRITAEEKQYMQDQLAKETVAAQEELGQYKTTIMVERRDANFVFLKDKINQMESVLEASGSEQAKESIKKYVLQSGKSEYTTLSGVARVRSYQIALFQALLYAKADPAIQKELDNTTGPCGCGVDGIYGIKTLLTSAQVLKDKDTSGFHGVLNEQTFNYLLSGTTVVSPPPPPAGGSEEGGLENVSDIPEDVMTAMGNILGDGVTIAPGDPLRQDQAGDWLIFDSNGNGVKINTKDNFEKTMHDRKVQVNGDARHTLMQHNEDWYIWSSKDPSGYYPVQMDATGKIIVNSEGEPLLLGNSATETIAVTPTSETIAVTGLADVNITKNPDGTLMYNGATLDFDVNDKTTLIIDGDNIIIEKVEKFDETSFSVVEPTSAIEEEFTPKVHEVTTGTGSISIEENEPGVYVYMGRVQELPFSFLDDDGSSYILSVDETGEISALRVDTQGENIGTDEKEEEARLAKEKEEEARLAKEKEEEARLAKEKEEEARLAKEKEEAREQAERVEAEEKAAQEKAEQQRLAQEEADKQRLAEIELKHTNREQLITESGIDENLVTYDKTTEKYVLPTINSEFDASHIQDTADLKESVASEAKKYMDDIVPAIEGHFSVLESVTEQRSALISSWNQSMNIKAFDDGFTNLPQAVSLQDDIAALQAGSDLINDFSPYSKLLQDCQHVEGVNSASLQEIGEIQQSIETQATQIANSAGIQYTSSQFTIEENSIPRGEVLKNGYEFVNDAGNTYIVSRLDTPNRGTYEVNEKPKELGVPEGWIEQGMLGEWKILKSSESGMQTSEHYLQNGSERMLVGEWVMQGDQVYKYDDEKLTYEVVTPVRDNNTAGKISNVGVSFQAESYGIVLDDPIFAVLSEYKKIPYNEIVGRSLLISQNKVESAVTQRVLSVMSYYIAQGQISPDINSKIEALPAYQNIHINNPIKQSFILANR